MVTEQQAADLVATIFRATRMPIADAEERRLRRKEFGEELMRVACSLEHAEEIARRCRTSFDEFPTIHQLHAIAAAITQAEPAPVNLGAADCERCNGTGWVPGHVTRAGVRYSCVARCACRKVPEVPAGQERVGERATVKPGSMRSILESGGVR